MKNIITLRIRWDTIRDKSLKYKRKSGNMRLINMRLQEIKNKV